MLGIIDKKKVNSMFISINANQLILSEEIVYFYPNKKFVSDKITIIPKNTTKSLQFYKKYINRFQNIKNFVKLMVSLNSDKTAYLISIGNIVKIKDANNEKICVMTSFNLLRFDHLKEVVIEDVNIFMISDNSYLEQFFKKLDYLISLNTIKDKANYFNLMSQEYRAIPLNINFDFLKNRTAYIETVLSTGNDFLFRDPLNESILTPNLNILILEFQNAHDDEVPIEIDLDYYENLSSEVKEIECTFITHHIPRIKSHRIYSKNDTSIPTVTNKGQGNDDNEFKNIDEMVFYDNIIDYEFSNNCCVFYDISINYGYIPLTNGNGLKIGHYIFNSNSAGTILFDFSFTPIGITSYGTNDYFTNNTTENNYNVFIPFNHIGVLYLLKKILDNKSIDHNIYSKNKNIKIESHTIFNSKIKDSDFSHKLKCDKVEETFFKDTSNTDKLIIKSYKHKNNKKKEEKKIFNNYIISNSQSLSENCNNNLFLNFKKSKIKKYKKKRGNKIKREKSIGIYSKVYKYKRKKASEEEYKITEQFIENKYYSKKKSKINLFNLK